jgi:hypothetical protein
MLHHHPNEAVFRSIRFQIGSEVAESFLWNCYMTSLGDIFKKRGIQESNIE